MLTRTSDLTREERLGFVETCLRLSASSDCTRMKFGAVVVKRRFWDGGATSDLVVIGQGYNRKASPCTAFVDCCDLRDRLKIPGRMRAELCEAVHAEWAAIINAGERGYQVRGAELIVCGKRPSGELYAKKWRNHSCTLCTRLMHAFGIARVWVPCATDAGADLFPLTSEGALTTSFEIAMGMRDLETGIRKEEEEMTASDSVSSHLSPQSHEAALEGECAGCLPRSQRPRDGIFLMELLKALYRSWDAETSADGANWTRECPPWGQCAVTALVVQDYMGGDFLRASLEAMPDPKIAAMRSHYWNRLPGRVAREVDLTERQFHPALKAQIPGGKPLTGKGDPLTREYILSNVETARRYARLKAKVGQILGE